MQNLHEVFRDLRRKRKSLACRTNCSELFSANRLLHRRSLRLEWLEDRSLLSFVPTGVDLLSISDSGVFDNDYITNLDNSSSQKALQFEVSGTSPSATVGIYADGILIGSVNASSDTTIVTTNGSYDLADGNHLITARQTKPGQGESEDSPALGIVVDTQAPATPVSPDLQAASDSGVSDTDNITNDNAPTIDFIAAPYFRFYRNGIQVGNDYETGTSYTDASRPDGTYDYTVCAVDVAGNVSLASAALSVMIDTEAPAAPAAPDLQAASDTGISDTDNLTNDTTPTFDAVGSLYFRLYRDGVQISGDYESGSYTTSINVDGTYEYTLIAVDAAGNVSALSAPLSVTIDTQAPAAPTSAPDLQAASDSGISDTDNITNDATPTFDVTAAPYFRLYRGTTQASGDYESGSSCTATIQPDGTYDYTVRTVDAAGNVSDASPALTVTVDAQAPAVPPAPDLQSFSDLGPSDTDNITNDTTPTFDAIGAPYFRLYRDGVQISGDYETGTTYTDSPQLDGTYEYTVMAVDAAGNESDPSNPLSVTIDTQAPSTPAAPDLQAASDTGISDTDNITRDSTPTFDVTAAPYFRLYRDTIQISGDYESGSYTAAAQADGTYAYTVRAVDAAGNESNLSPALSVTIDTTAPAAPPAPDLQAASDSGISDTDNITNDATPTFDVTAAPYFRLYRGTTQASGDYESGTSCTATLQPDSTYDYTVRAVDAAGNLSSASATLSVTIDTVDPFPTEQIAKLLAGDGETGDSFGYIVSIDGSTAIIGAYGDDDNGSYSGSAYIFEHTGSGWIQVTKLTAADGAAYDYFGYSVSISDSVAIVGARGDDDNGSDSGSAYIFEDSGSGWMQTGKLMVDEDGYSRFGASVSISGNSAIVGFGTDQRAGTPVYVFEKTAEGWIQAARLTGDAVTKEDGFGTSVSINGNTAIIGACLDDDNGSYSGSAYIFEDAGSGWVQVAKLTADDGEAYDSFGGSVSISGNVAIVGAPYDDDNGSYSGSAYIFEDAGSGWTQTAKLTAADADAYNYFGSSVSISGSMAVVGASSRNGYGSAYLFENTGSVWTQLSKLTPLDDTSDDKLGISVSIDSSLVIVGAPSDSGATPYTGAAYLFSSAVQLADDTGHNKHDRITSDTTPELTFIFTEPVYGQASDVTVLDPGANPFAPDSITGWGTNTLTLAFSTPLIVDGEYTVILSATSAITDVAGNAINNGNDEIVTFTIDTVGPTVEHVLVKGTAWDNAFLDYLDSQGLGHPTTSRLGYRMPAGAAQKNILSWGNIDTITIAFNENVVVTQDDLALCSINVPSYAIAGFSYDSTNYTATWTLAALLGADTLWINVDDTTQDVAGNALDGEWQYATSAFPSGDGSSGGLFRFRISVLPGDANRDGSIGPVDATIVATNWGSAGATLLPGDFTGDGIVDMDDAAVLANHWGTQLPPLLPGDADYSGTVDLADAAILAKNWGARYQLLPGDANRNGVVDQDDAVILSINWGANNASWQMGDFNGDEIVDTIDLVIMATNWGATSGRVTWGDGDFNDDGIVDTIDLTIMAANWGKTLLAVVKESSEPLATAELNKPVYRSNVELLTAESLSTTRRLNKLIRRDEIANYAAVDAITRKASLQAINAACDVVLTKQYGPQQAERISSNEYYPVWYQTPTQKSRQLQKKDGHNASRQIFDLFFTIDEL